VADLLLVLRKELTEWLHSQNPRTSLLQLAFLLLVFGLLVPVRFSAEAGRFLPYMIALMPVFLVSSLMADSFAGERERGTLETLLVTPLSDRSILVGKISAGVLYAWSYTLIVFLVSVVMLGLGRGLLFSPLTIVAALVGALLVAVLLGTIGAWVSMRAKTVRSAQQSLGLPLMALYLLIGFGIPALTEILPVSWAARLASLLSRLRGAPLLAVALCGLVLLDGVSVAVALWRFCRARLIHLE
jgi:ABC-2 type transport system permease protein